MCGIAGIFNLCNSSSNSFLPLKKMTKTMKKRGPDDEGYVAFWANGEKSEFFGDDTPDTVKAFYPNLISSKSDVKNNILVLGHRRLSIQDLTPLGHQPMHDSTCRYWIVFNGEIYNFQELRNELVLEGYQFRTKTDTEVVLSAYSKWQEKCLSRFNGDFSFVIWDHKNQSVFCARDRIGVKPFYYILNENQFIFGSDIKTLLASGLHSAVPDDEGLYLAMAFGMAPRPITAFKGIRALEQAHWMRLHRSGRIEKGRYWNIPLGSQVSSMSETEASELIENHLKRAVARRLIADVPVGTFMSGGIDSTTISAIAAQQKPGIKAFTLGYQKNAPEFDEVPQAKATAKMYPIQHIVQHVNPSDCLEDLQEWILGYEEPFYSLPANHAISKIVKANSVKVVLSGLGGDELFAGYDYYKYADFFRIPWLPIWVFQNIKNTRIQKGLELLTADTPDRLHTIFFRHETDAALRQLFQSNSILKIKTEDRIHDLYAKNMKFTDAIEAISFMDLVNYIGNHHVHRMDQFTMSYSIEARFPFLDHELIEAAFRVPSKYKLKKSIHKFVLREVAKRHIAPSCLKMGKKGFGLPLKQWLQGPLKPLLDVSLENLSKRPQFDYKDIYRRKLAYEQGHLGATKIWHLVALELWFKYFIDNPWENIARQNNNFS